MDVTGSIDTKDPNDTNKEVRRIYEDLFGSSLFDRVEHTLYDVVRLFEGNYPGYHKCDTRYHDLEHTLQAYLAAARIIDGLIRETPARMPQEFAVLSLIGTIGHDTGFIKETWDTEGSGAKYTLTHVSRSSEFMAKYLLKSKFSSSQVQSVQNMISCTGLDGDLSKIHFTSEREKEAGCVLGTADYLGQMSDPNYVEKLPLLYDEYEEGHFPGYDSAQDLLQKTPKYFEDFVMKRLIEDFQSVYQFAATHFGGKNLYIEGIKKNIELVKHSLKSDRVSSAKAEHRQPRS
ncbi:MAG: hypothetical protein ISS53_01680 [Dehalococcoidia bacterium]|nr:hypothetical protein [Dehalococcoidia bacterium]